MLKNKNLASASFKEKILFNSRSLSLCSANWEYRNIKLMKILTAEMRVLDVHSRTMDQLENMTIILI